MNPAENYILNQPEPYKTILLHLQILVEHTLPELELKYKYRKMMVSLRYKTIEDIDDTIFIDVLKKAASLY